LQARLGHALYGSGWLLLASKTIVCAQDAPFVQDQGIHPIHDHRHPAAKTPNQKEQLPLAHDHGIDLPLFDQGLDQCCGLVLVVPKGKVRQERVAEDMGISSRPP
jgi:hypothetical protein